MASASQLDGKVCVVTGASTGLGRAIALRLAQGGAKLVVCASRRSIHEGTDVSTEDLINQKYGAGRAIFQKTDLSVVSDIEACIKEAIAKGGRLDVLVNNAAILSFGKCHEMPQETFEYDCNVNIRAPFIASSAAIKQFLGQEKNEKGSRGSIINIGSFASEVTGPVTIAYSTSKGALLNMTKSIAVDYAAEGIQSNIVLPGYQKTEMTKAFFETDWIVDRMRFLTPWWDAPENSCMDGVANMVAFLASNESKYCTGASFKVDGGILAQ